jgi:hypothetical protein
VLLILSPFHADGTTALLKGQVISKPASGFRPRRDVDLFLDRDCERTGHGYIQGADVLKQLLEQEGMKYGNPGRNALGEGLLDTLQYEFVNYLGESKYMHGLNTIPPSRFSSTNSNGLWEYSPFLCGVGLVEGLELSYALSLLSHPFTQHVSTRRLHR